MTPAPLAASMTAAPAAGGFTSWLRRAERWLDDRGKAAWIAAMVLGFIFAWPVGLGLLAYMIWSKRMFSRSSCAQNTSIWGKMREHHSHHTGHCGRPGALHSSGNAAFDAYKSETLRRLEEEQQAFEAFLQRLRDAKDKSEFDSFMDDRAQTDRAEAARAQTARAEAARTEAANPAPLPPLVPPAPAAPQSGAY